MMVNIYLLVELVNNFKIADLPFYARNIYIDLAPAEKGTYLYGSIASKFSCVKRSGENSCHIHNVTHV